MDAHPYHVWAVRGKRRRTMHRPTNTCTWLIVVSILEGTYTTKGGMCLAVVTRRTFTLGGSTPTQQGCVRFDSLRPSYHNRRIPPSTSGTDSCVLSYATAKRTHSCLISPRVPKSATMRNLLMNLVEVRNATSSCGSSARCFGSDTLNKNTVDIL